MDQPWLPPNWCEAHCPLQVVSFIPPGESRVRLLSTNAVSYSAHLDEFFRREFGGVQLYHGCEARSLVGSLNRPILKWASVRNQMSLDPVGEMRNLRNACENHASHTLYVHGVDEASATAPSPPSPFKKFAVRQRRRSDPWGPTRSDEHPDPWAEVDNWPAEHEFISDLGNR